MRVNLPRDPPDRGGKLVVPPAQRLRAHAFGGGVSYVAPMSYRVHVPHMYCIDLHVPVLYMYVSTVDLAVDLVGRPILVGTDPAV